MSPERPVAPVKPEDPVEPVSPFRPASTIDSKVSCDDCFLTYGVLDQQKEGNHNDSLSASEATSVGAERKPERPVDPVTPVPPVNPAYKRLSNLLFS